MGNIIRQKGKALYRHHQHDTDFMDIKKKCSTLQHNKISEHVVRRYSQVVFNKKDKNFQNNNCFEHNHPRSGLNYEKTKQDLIQDLKIEPDLIYELEEWYDDHYEYFYHYTSISNLKQILKDNFIKVYVNPIVDKFGSGVFLSCVSPEFSDSLILRNSYRYNSNKDSCGIECAIAFQKCYLKPVVKINETVGGDCWKYEQDIDLRLIAFKIVLRPSKN